MEEAASAEGWLQVGLRHGVAEELGVTPQAVELLAVQRGQRAQPLLAGGRETHAHDAELDELAQLRLVQGLHLSYRTAI